MTLRWVAAALLAAFSLGLIALTPEEHWRPEWDSAVYLLGARSIDRGNGYRYLGEPLFLRPPGLSVALSWFTVDGEFDYPLLNRGIATSAAAAVAAIFLAFRRRHGDAGALAIALLTGTSAVFVQRLGWVDSEFPFLACLFAGVACLEAADRHGRHGRLAAAAGAVLLAGAVQLRTVALLALPGAVWTGLRSRLWRGLAGAAAALVLSVPWALEASSRAHDARRPVEQLKLFDYATAMWHQDPGDPGSERLHARDWIGRVRRNGSRIAADLTATTLGTAAAGAQVLVVAALASGFALALRRGAGLLEWFGAAYLVLLLTYFAYVPRLLLPLVPIAYAWWVTLAVWAAEHAGQYLGHRLRWQRGCTSLAAALLCVNTAALLCVNAAAVPNSLAAGERPMGVSSDGEQRSLGTQADRWADYRRAADWLRQHTPRDAVIAADFAPIVSLLSDRTTVTTRFQREPDLLGRAGANYAVCFWWTRREFEAQAAERVRNRTQLPSHFDGEWIRIYELETPPAAPGAAR